MADTASHSACVPAGAIQSVTLSGCNSVLVIGYVRVPVYSAPEATITLSLLNGTVASPCGGAYGAGQASQVVQIRRVSRMPAPFSETMQRCLTGAAHRCLPCCTG